MGSKLKLTIVLIDIALISAGCLTRLTYAVGSGWVDGKLYTSESNYISDNSRDCSNYVNYITATDEGEKAVGLVRGCIVGGDKFDFMRSREPSGSPLSPYMNITGIINPADSDKMPRELKRSGYDKFWNFEGVDALVQSDFNPTSGKTEVLVYTDLPKALYAAAVDGDGTPLEYQLNPISTQRYTFDLPISSMLMSDDKKYLVVKYYDGNSSYGGFRKIDTTTGKSIDYVVNNLPFNAYYELYAMTQDARYITVGRDIYDLAACGELDDGRQECRSRNLDEYLTGHYGYSIWVNEESLKFVDHDSHLDLTYGYLQMPTDDMLSYKKAELSLTPQIEYLALGDSYSSGEGDIGKKPDGASYYTPDTDPGCHLSTRSYPFLLRDAWGINKGEMQSVACSGALVKDDYISDIKSYQGQHRELERLTPDARQGMIDAAYDYFVPGRIPQIEFVKKYRPKVVTLTGGGNDVGFANILKACAGDMMNGGDDCEYVEGGALHSILNDAIDSQYTPIKTLISSIKEASPGVKIYYIGYPSFIGGSHSICALNSGSLSKKERDMINEAVHRLNNVIHQAAISAGAQYVDIEDALTGGRLCEGSMYMTGIWDVGLLNAVTGDTQQVFHPNAKGHEEIKNQITARIKDPITDYQSSEGNIPIKLPTIKTFRALMTSIINTTRGEHLIIKLPSGYTEGNVNADVTIFSTAINLGQYKTNPDGSLLADITVPSELDGGTHTIVVDTTSVGGEQTRYYQFINIIQATNSSNSLNSRKISNGDRYVTAEPNILQGTVTRSDISIDTKENKTESRISKPAVTVKDMLPYSTKNNFSFKPVIIIGILAGILCIGFIYARKIRK